MTMTQIQCTRKYCAGQLYVDPMTREWRCRGCERDYIVGRDGERLVRHEVGAVRSAPWRGKAAL